ncbi:zinc-binding dehydrogenase [Salinilacihabitans rarus]|uniref:zinc-binding dehydrogenase n=1 Tax=Salinilacihabitans rarus TaxID=2961596 RepID=UPI0020C8BAB6|nr:zinc-binding dehydrogenase [Salinilacihabitans rarus]
MTARRLCFTGPRSVEVRDREVPDPGPEEVRVRTVASAISAGTEGLLYRGEAPAGLAADETLDALDGDLSYPLTYGYAAAGEVDAVGECVPEAWLGRRVFAYNPHESRFLARPEDLLAIPDGVPTREATLLASVETAVTFLLDGEPLLGERAVVFGQGIVGLLTSALLAEMPLDALVTVEPWARRRAVSEKFGADRTLDPADCEVADAVEAAAGGRVDLAYELSGNPDALDDAIAATEFDGRVVIGSWYGTKPATVDLGGRFHRSRIDLRSSQVSTIPPRHGGRWSRRRRHEVAWDRLERLDADRLLTHEFPLEEAADAYRLLAAGGEDALQVLFTYD